MFAAIVVSIGFVASFALAVVLDEKSPVPTTAVRDAIFRDRWAALASVLIAGCGAVAVLIAYRERMRDEHIAERESEIAARREALDAALKSLDAITDDRELSDEVVKLLRARHETRINQLPDSLDPDAHDVSAAGTDLTRELITAERKFIHVLLRDGSITDESRRRIERDLDLEEASLANREYRRVPL